ncbi:hypoxanthine phosphoribosyltransferase [Paragonimus westermani]|uniref:Hypoxanthine phosphoribosyltransferase n=1 Tax=Paragonimus westermani TaxID=34504 RepID=A0A5J4NT52_9TREM|nr:hypoxanthine phosphoribosyltransferase [Paragonimus westermani]
MVGGDGDCVIIPDEYLKLPLEQFCIPKAYENCLLHVMISDGMIRDRIKHMALKIVKEYETSFKDSINLLCVLKGAFRFLGDLFNELKDIIRIRESPLEFQLNFVRLQSYMVPSYQSVSSITLQNDKSVREPLITGLDDASEFRGKSTIYSCLFTTCLFSLLLKRLPTGILYRPDFVGFEIPDEFVVGYALDYNEHFRDLPHICVINQHGREKFRIHQI